MKKVLVLLAAAATLMAVTSCQKEGVYNPKEKIVKIQKSALISTKEDYNDQVRVVASDTIDKYVAEEWVWDGKLLTNIKNYEWNRLTESAAYAYTMNFSYDGKLLTTIKYGSEIVTYNYVDNNITKIDIYDRADLRRTLDITHDGKKIVKIVMTTYFDDDNPSALSKYVISSLLPGKNTAQALLDNKASKGTATYVQTIDFTYDGKNVSKMVMTAPDNRTMTTEFTYDKNKNPFKGCFALAITDEGTFCLNENNILTEKSTLSVNGVQSDPQTTTYTYEYDGKYPVSYSYTETEIEGPYTTNTIITTYYEYAE